MPAEPELFNMVTADLEEKLRRMKWKKVKLGEEKVYSLAYADNIVLLEEEKNEMRSVIRRLEEYLEQKGLEMNVSED